jgi:hypothetical protein
LGLALACVGLLAFALVPARVLGQAPVRVEGIAALVGGDSPGPGTVVILRSDVVLRARIALAGASEQLPTGPLPESLLAATLDEIVGEVLIAREADRLRAAQPEPERIERERARLARQAGGPERLAALLRATGATADEVEAIARRRAYVGAFLQANLQGSTVVSDAQLARVYESGNHPFQGRPLDEVREPLRAFVAQSALRRDVRRWIEVLRRRTPVRVVAEWRRDRTSEGAGDGG